MTHGKKLIFIHLPKTGGMTLRSIVERNFAAHAVHTVNGEPGSADAFVRLPEGRRREIGALQGHMPFGLHEHLCAPVNYATMLRHPVERVLSLYFYLRAVPANPFHPQVAAMSLEEFGAGGFPQARNHQTRLLSGAEDDFSAGALAAARRNLAEHFAAVGLNERFDESLVLFRKLLGLKKIHYTKLNVSAHRPRRREVPQSTVKLIEESNALDMELYDYAVERFETLVGAETPSFADEVRAFRRANRIYGALARGYDAARGATPGRLKTVIKQVVGR